MATRIEELSQDLAALVERHRPTVVRVEARRRRPSTGILWSKDGHVLTASHAVERDEDLRISVDGESTVSAELVGRDPATDLALLKLTGAQGADPSFTDADDIKVGNLLVALGRPGRTVRASWGMVAAVADGWRNPAGQRLDRYIEADGGLPGGFSGGPMFDASGRFVGLATSGLLPHANMIVPAKSVRQVVATLQAHGGIRRGYLGIGSHPIRLQGRARELAQADHGLLVFSVEPGGPSEQSGLLVGDVLLTIDGQPTRHLEELLGLLTEDRVGRGVPVHLLRAGQLHDLTVTIGERK